MRERDGWRDSEGGETARGEREGEREGGERGGRQGREGVRESERDQPNSANKDELLLDTVTLF